MADVRARQGCPGARAVARIPGLAGRTATTPPGSTGRIAVTDAVPERRRREVCRAGEMSRRGLRLAARGSVPNRAGHGPVGYPTEGSVGYPTALCPTLSG